MPDAGRDIPAAHAAPAVSLDAFLAEVRAVDPTEHTHLAAPHQKCC